VFEGALRKWVVGDGSIPGRIAYLSKDICMLAFLALGSGRANPLADIARPFLVWGVALLGIGAVLSSAFGIDPIGFALTIKTFFMLPIAAWVAGQLLPADSLRRFAMWIAIFSLPLAVLGVLQFFSAPNSVLNRYSAFGENVAATTAGVNERVRATGTFSYISGFGEFAPMAVWAGIVTFTLARTLRERWLGYAALVAGLCCALVTVSRAVALISFALFAVWAGAGGQFGQKARIVFSIGVVALVALLFTGRWDDADEIVSTVYLRHTSSKNTDSISGRLWYSYILPLDAITIAPIGMGLGSQQSAMLLAGSDTSRRSGSAFESPWGKTVLELGIYGLLGFLVTWGVVLAPLRAAYRMYQRSETRTVLVVTGAVLLLKALLGYQFNHVAAYFFWSTSATLLALGNGIRTPLGLTKIVGFDRHNERITR
jgi:hypothetical protein